MNAERPSGKGTKGQEKKKRFNVARMELYNFDGTPGYQSAVWFGITGALLTAALAEVLWLEQPLPTTRGDYFMLARDFFYHYGESWDGDSNESLQTMRLASDWPDIRDQAEERVKATFPELFRS